jgi:hypothetical protein
MVFDMENHAGDANSIAAAPSKQVFTLPGGLCAVALGDDTAGDIAFAAPDKESPQTRRKQAGACNS